MKPFSGLTFCCTGIAASERNDIEDKITTLGGTQYSDLMSSVSFLVVGSMATEKYRYSVRYRYDMTFLTAQCIDDIYKRWTMGEDTGLDPVEQSMAVFAGLSVCVARVERAAPDVAARHFDEKFRTPPLAAKPTRCLADVFLLDAITDCVAANGGAPSSSLTPATSVLVGTDTSGRRYTMAKQWGIPVVHPLWVYDSCLRGAALNTEDYLLTGNPADVYNNASFVWNDLYQLRINRSTLPARGGEGSRKPTREKPLKRSSRVWSSIMDQPTRERTGDIDGEDDENTNHENITASEKQERAPTLGLFGGLMFLPVGLSIPQQEVLKGVVESHAGEVADSANDDTITHVLVLVKNGPQASLMLSLLPSKLRRRIALKEVHTVTDWFIERSIFYNRVRYDSWSRLLHGLVPLHKRFKVCITGFTGVELLHIEKLITYLNLEYCDTLTSDRDLLIVNVVLFKDSLATTSPELFKYRHQDVLDCPVYSTGDGSRSVSVISSKNKISAAKRWNIPVVSLAYLWEMIQTLAGKPSVHVPDVVNPTWCLHAPSSAPRPMTLLDYARKLSNNFASPSKSASPLKAESASPLPSPRKSSKEKLRYGRLAAGKASLTEKLKNVNDDAAHDHHRLDDLVNDDDKILTQVAYVNQDSINNNEELMKKLQGGPRKRPRRK